MRPDPSPRILVVGAGGLGSVFGGLLAERGLTVTLLGRSSEHAEAISSAGGVTMVGYGGERLIKLQATADPKSLTRADIVIFLCKAGANVAAARSVQHLFDRDAVAITFQNGLGNEEVLEDILGQEKVVAGFTAQGARLERAGVVRNFAELPTYVGERGGGLSDRVRWLARVFSAHGLPTTANANIMRAKWIKLFANIAFSASSGLTRLSIADVGHDPALRRLALCAIEEAAAVAAAEGYVIDHHERRSMFDELLASPGASANTSSMYRDLLARKQSEVDHIYGTVIARGIDHGVPTPTLEALFALVKGVESSWATVAHA